MTFYYTVKFQYYSIVTMYTYMHMIFFHYMHVFSVYCLSMLKTHFYSLTMENNIFLILINIKMIIEILSKYPTPITLQWDMK